MRFFGMPTSPIGWWAVGLAGITLACGCGVFIIWTSATSSVAHTLESFSLLAILYWILYVGCLASGIAATVALLVEKERSFLVWAALGPLVVVLGFWLVQQLVG